MDNLYFNIFILVLGLVFGSFMNVLIYRVPRGMNIAVPASACPVCKSAIRWYSNIPVLSYIVQRGRCRDCGVKISIQYPLVELITGILFLCVALKFGITLLTLKYCVFVYILLVAAFTDLNTRLDEKFDCGYIPDHYTIGGVLLGYIFSFVAGDLTFYDSLAGSGAGAFFLFIVAYLFKLIRNIDGLGDADALLMGAVGSFLGAKSVIFVTTLSAILGSLTGIVIVKVMKNSRYEFPFGPMIAFAAVIYMFFGNYIANLAGF